MLKRCSRFLKSLAKQNNFIMLGVLLIIGPAFAGDPPIDRNFLSLPDGRWIKLKKVGDYTTRMILGDKHKKKVWSREYEQEYDRLWEYAYFVRLKRNRFLVDLDHDSFPEVGIATYDMGNAMIRNVLIFSVKKDHLEFVKIKGPYNLAADENVFP